ncbi:MAG: amidohydrolase family protein [Anaerolineales bacterium]|nr:amidohydrolase family protein [Anaerolineales bacterium]
MDSTAEDPPGGEIQRHENGQPTGILFEKAMELVSSKIPKPSVDELAERVNEAQQVLWKMGITSIHDFDKSSAFSAFQRIHNRGELGLRVIKNISYKNLDEAIALGLRTGFGDAWLRIGHIKFYVDGALGPMTAAMIDSYEDSSDNFGLLRTGGEELTDMTFNAVKSGLAVSVHAIGDRANRITLDVFQAVREAEKSNNLPHLRHRIEHLQLLHPDDVHRPASLGVVASMQPYHATSDMEMAQNLWGKRSRLSYAWNSQLKAGAVLAFGSDAPVEIPNPFLGIHAAVTRKRLDGTPGPEGWIPEERISLKDTLFAYTRGPAYTAGLEKQQGMLKPGYFADLITLDTDPFTCPEDDLPQIAPVATMVGGQWKYRAF